MKSHSTFDKNIFLITGIWLIVIFIINPIGDFPLNDDWAYGIIVKRMIEDDTLKLINWGEMTLVTHLFFGYAFTSLLGFSFTVLRCSTLLLSLLGLLGIYQTVLLMKLDKRTALIATIVVMANPVFMALSFSYMTDVPFMTFVTWSTYFFIKTYNTANKKLLFIAVFLCVWAILIRQLALMLSMAWLFALLIDSKSKQFTLWWKWLPVLTVGGTLFLYSYFMKQYGMLPANYGSKLDLVLSNLSNFDLRMFRNSVGYIFVFFTYMGLFITPLLALYRWSKLSKRMWIGIITYTLLISGGLILMGKALPSIDNIFVDFGLGPSTLLDHPGGFRSIPGGNAPMILRWAITILGTFSGSVLLIVTFDWLKKPRREINFPKVFSFLFILIYIAPFIITGYYDRYLIILLPAAFVILSDQLSLKPSIWSKGVMASTLFVFMVFSIFATHDLLSWNRVRWQVIDGLIANKVPLDQIEAGVEFDGFYHFTDDDPEWWKRITPTYKVTFVPLDNYNTLSVHPYKKWMPGKEGIIVLSKIKDVSNEKP
tara:strand:+ start:46857 stop:48473 length:1617 start_codon:yes stop_codon:yes gene_type:complete